MSENHRQAKGSVRGFAPIPTAPPKRKPVSESTWDSCVVCDAAVCKHQCDFIDAKVTEIARLQGIIEVARNWVKEQRDSGHGTTSVLALLDQGCPTEIDEATPSSNAPTPETEG